MERDFLGLGSQSGSVTVKEAVYDGLKDSAIRNSGMQWSFSNKGSSVPQFLSFKAQEDRPRKTSLDALASPGFMTISTADAFESDQNPVSGIVQRFDAHPVRPQAAGIIPFSNQSNQTGHIVISNSVLPSCLASNGQNVVNSTIKTQPLGGFPRAGPVLSVLTPRGPVVGTTDLRNSSKPSGAPSQLTIFYGGSVCVYDDLSPEKAQAIMLLAGNGSCPIQTKIACSAPMQPSVSMSSKTDCFLMNQPCSSALPSTLSLTSHSGPQTVAVSSTTNEQSRRKPLYSSASNVNYVELPNTVSSAGATSSASVPSVALPQARKASLARFLEKRKERATNTSPYTLNKNSLQDTPGSEFIGFPVNSSCPLPAFN